MKYIKKPVVIEAIKYDGENKVEVQEFVGKYLDFTKNKQLKIDTLEGERLANKGDYIIKGVKGEFYPCKPDIFEKTYEAINKNKKLFIETINFIMKKDKKIKKVNEALYQISMDFYDLSGLFFDYNETIISVLESFAPKEKADYISWWVFETSFGKENTKIYDKDNKVLVNLKTASDLYDYIFGGNK